MGKRTAENILKEINQQEVLTRTDYTFVEYVNELLKIQEVLAGLVYGKEKSSNVRMNEIVAKLEMEARERGLSRDTEVREGLNALRLLNKEICVSLAGKSGEDRVANCMGWVTRLDKEFYRNVYISDEAEETELDGVIVTKNGVIILEVKNAKEDITIAEDGRILFCNASCYHDISVGEKMARKRRLLKKRLETELENRGIKTPVVVDSLIVFSTPKNTRIQIHDNYQKERYCLKGHLFREVDTFVSDVVYQDTEYEVLKDIIADIETEQKRFELKFDPQVLKVNISKALAVFYDAGIIVENEQIADECNEPKHKVSFWRRFFVASAAAASAFCVGIGL